MVSVIMTAITMVANWMIFKKMGRQGWEGIVPVYNMYVLCEELYGKGWKFLFFLIPLYNIYFGIKMYIDWARAFHKSTGFAIGMLLLPFIFTLILAFDNSQYKDGSKQNVSVDFVSQMVDKTKEVAANVAAPKVQHDEAALEKINQLADLKEKGVISEEEFNEKKAELLNKL